MFARQTFQFYHYGGFAPLNGHPLLDEQLYFCENKIVRVNHGLAFAVSASA